MKRIFAYIAVFALIVFLGGTITKELAGSPSSNSFLPAVMKVVPSWYTGAAGGATFLGPLSNAQRTYQMLIHDSLLNGLEGMELKAITWRLLPSATSNWPAANITFANYDVYIGPGVDPALRSTTFDNNYLVPGVKKKVRSGPLTINAGSFPSGGSPTTFGSDITFDSSYVYTGGHLTIEIRHQGFSGTSASVDAIGTSASGYGTYFSSLWVADYNGTTGTLNSNFCIHRLNTDAMTSIGNESGVIKDFKLNQNYPNPFNPVTNITFTMPKAGSVSLRVFDVAGAEIMTIINNEQLSAGTKSQFFDASALSSGVYFYSLFIDGAKVDTKKMMLVK